MISRNEFERRQNLDTLLLKFPDMYAVQSEVEKGTVYAMNEHKFAVFESSRYVFCPLHEVPKLAAALTKQDMADEILSIYEDLKDLKRMRVNYSQRSEA